jgi:signal transduction histidine kinase
VVREAVSNSAHHADATKLTVRVTVQDELSIEVADARGSLTVEPGADGGTLLRWRAPLP